MMTREQMMDKVMQENGLEDKWTIWFCKLCEDESLSQSALEMAMVNALTMPMIEVEE